MDKTKNNIRGFIKISDVTDVNNPEILVQKENAIHYENFSQALANSVTNRSTGYIEEMHFGNGGTAVDSTGVITYTGPSSAEARAHFSVAGGSGLTYNSGTGEFGTNAIPNGQLANSSVTIGAVSYTHLTLPTKA